MTPDPATSYTGQAMKSFGIGLRGPRATLAFARSSRNLTTTWATIVAAPMVLLSMVAALCVSLSAQAAPSAQLPGQLRAGGFVLVIRHASSPQELPSREEADRENTKQERQLDEKGRRTATAMGLAVRNLRIPIGAVFSSPTYRARQTVTLAGLGRPTLVDALGDTGQSMQAAADAQAAWLRDKVCEVPRMGNTVLVTHQPNIARAFPDLGTTVAEGETVVFRPDGHGGTTIAGRIPIEAWPR